MAECVVKNSKESVWEGKNMDHIIWLITTIPCSALMTGFGIYAWNRKKPMWFWSGSSEKEIEVSDVRAYNHANGVMWIVYSLVLWAASIAGFWNGTAALTLIVLAIVVGLPALMMVYQRIYKKYKV